MGRDEIRESLRLVLRELSNVAADVNNERSDKMVVTGLNGILEMLGELVNDIEADANPTVAECAEDVKLSYMPPIPSRPAFID